MNKKSKWLAILSTTEPYNNIGIIQVRRGNINSETWYIPITQNGAELNFIAEGIKKVYFCTEFANKFVVEQEAEIIDAQKGHIKYVMNEFDMQKLGLQQAYFKFEDGEGNYRGTTQSFTYRIIGSIDNSCFEMGSYVTRLEELLKLYSDFFENQSQSWIDFVTANKEILESIDPGGKILLELIEARDGEKSLNARLKRDKTQLHLKIESTEKKIQDQIDFLKTEHYLTKIGEINKTRTLIDNDFSKNHTVTKINEVDVSLKINPIIIATVDDNKQNRFKLRKVGVI